MRTMHRRMVYLGLPLIAGFLLFYIIPFALSLYYSLIESAFSSRFVGIDNYVAVLNNKYYQLALKNTLEFTLTSVPVLVLMAMGLSLLFYGLGGGHRYLRGAFVLPMLLPSAAIVPLIKQLMAVSQSPAYMALEGLGMATEQIVRIPVYLFYMWKNMGFHIVLILAALTMIPHEINEAAALDGARGFRKFCSITFPLIRPAVFFVLILSIMQSFRVFKETYLLYGSYPNPSVYFVQHYMNNHFFKLNYQNLTSGAIIFAAVIYLAVALCYRYGTHREVVL